MTKCTYKKTPYSARLSEILPPRSTWVDKVGAKDPSEVPTEDGRMTKISKTDKICAAARLLEQGIDPDDLDRIRTETGCTKRQSEQIADSMRD